MDHLVKKILPREITDFELFRYLILNNLNLNDVIWGGGGGERERDRQRQRETERDREREIDIAELRNVKEEKC